MKENDLYTQIPLHTEMEKKEIHNKIKHFQSVILNVVNVMFPR